MEKNEIPKVVLNYTQVNNPTQVVNEPHENSVQAIGKAVKEYGEKPERLMDTVVSFVNAFWTGIFKGAWFALKAGILPLFVFYYLFFSLISLHNGNSFEYSIKMPIALLFEIGSYFIKEAPDLFRTFAPLIIIAFSGIVASYVFACMSSRSMYKNDPEKRKAARRAIFLTSSAAFLAGIRKSMKEDRKKNEGK